MKNWNLIFRRTHLYLGLLLIPWMLVYAVSTLMLNHRGITNALRPADPQWVKVWEKDYRFDMPADDVPLRETAGRILEENGLKGAYGVNRHGQTLNINLFKFWRPVRLQYQIQQGRLTAEEKKFSFAELMVRMHFRAGYGQPGFLNDLWAVAVDLYCITSLVWVATGLYLWWKISSVRRAGWLTIAAGALTFVILLLTL
ncbi:MAG TPA: hypothetical protein DCY13_01455 [Verrucomicrobiales bacterium]|nr:hypothetical protein [Verrucomicrobiales bacterium]